MGYEGGMEVEAGMGKENEMVENDEEMAEVPSEDHNDHIANKNDNEERPPLPPSMVTTMTALPGMISANNPFRLFFTR